MRFVHKTVEINPDSFAPELHLTVALPMELAKDNLTNEEVQAAYTQAGLAFVELIKAEGNK